MPWKISLINSAITKSFPKFSRRSNFQFIRFSSKSSQSKSDRRPKEYIISHYNNYQNPEYASLLSEFMKNRTNIDLLLSNDSRLLAAPRTDPVVYWYLAQNANILDSFVLERHYLSGKTQLSNDETVAIWNKKINQRTNPKDNDTTFQKLLFLIQRMSYVAKSLQYSLLNTSSDSNAKADASPVTYLDYGIQISLLNFLLSSFPDDYFIVEESLHEFQEILSSHENDDNSTFFNKIIEFLQIVQPNTIWNKEKILELFSKCEERRYSSKKKNINSNGSNTLRKIWIIDPIDGTKGFLQQKQFCIAMTAVEFQSKKPVFTTISCPNIHMKRIISGKINPRALEEVNSLISIDPPISVDSLPSSETIRFPSPDGGCMVYSLYDQENGGSTGELLSRSYSMPWESAYPLSLDSSPSSNVKKKSDYIVCFPVEKKHHNQDLTQQIVEKIAKDSQGETIILPLCLHSQVKYCLLLLNPSLIEGIFKLSAQLNYVEKIYDHLPGYHLLSLLLSTSLSSSSSSSLMKKSFLTNLNDEEIQFDFEKGILANTRSNIPRPDKNQQHNQSIDESEFEEDNNKERNGYIVSTNAALHELLIRFFSKV